MYQTAGEHPKQDYVICKNDVTEAQKQKCYNFVLQKLPYNIMYLLKVH